MIDPGLKNKVAIVTGANHGIGAAIAKALAKQGVKVFINYLRIPTDSTSVKESEPGEKLYRAKQTQSAEAVVAEIRQGGGEVEAWEADLAKPATIPELFDRAEQSFGTVDILVNNAAYCSSDTFIPSDRLKEKDKSAGGFSMQTITAESHDKHFAVNSRAVALMTAEFARRYLKEKKNWGRIINVSTDGASCFTGEISYGASKYALESYSRAAACELGKYGITVNIISPGPIQTGYITREMEQKEVRNIPLGRIGVPDDIADVAVFLASEQARFLTGQILYVGGGHVMM